MKRFFTTLLLTIMAGVTLGQKFVDWPPVEESPSDKLMSLTISRVAIDDEITAVYFDAITSPKCEDCWISLASNTYLTVADKHSSYRIIEWGVVGGNEPLNLDFDQRYSMPTERQFTLYMTFPLIPYETKSISIKENTGSQYTEGFYWKNIRLDRSSADESQTTNRQRAQNTITDFTPSGSGTCFAISADGLVDTCEHVVSDGGRLRIRGVNGNFNKTYNAVIVATDRNNDLAILRITESAFKGIDTPPYTIATQQASVGDKVYVLGYPLRAYMGDEIKLTDGLISSRSGYRGDPTSYQISAPVQPGNSGDPLFDEKGNIVGVVNARLEVESAAYSVKTPYLHTLVSRSTMSQSFRDTTR